MAIKITENKAQEAEAQEVQGNEQEVKVATASKVSINHEPVPPVDKVLDSIPDDEEVEESFIKEEDAPAGRKLFANKKANIALIAFAAVAVIAFVVAHFVIAAQ